MTAIDVTPTLISVGPSVGFAVKSRFIGLGPIFECNMHVGWGTRAVGCGDPMRGPLRPSLLGLHANGVLCALINESRPWM